MTTNPSPGTSVYIETGLPARNLSKMFLTSKNSVLNEKSTIMSINFSVYLKAPAVLVSPSYRIKLFRKPYKRCYHLGLKEYLKMLSIIACCLFQEVPSGSHG